ncbi:MAG: T9SS type A sorting domain-containing protein [Bacteroidales bacterium]|nr:T9SS type A sorting domain-containing protein [Bacteroidales bacterium]
MGKYIWIIGFIFLFRLEISGQERELFSTQISSTDSILLSNLPELKLPDSYKGTDAPLLPDFHDNSQLQFFRPILDQVGWSCGQFSSIGYTYTYELNRVRNTAADTSIHQYSPLYTWNFFNNGENQVGVCFYYSFEAIKSNGHMNIADYGGLSLGSQYWPSGYDKYYRGMLNQLDGVFSIYLGDEEGIQTVKYWLFDHLEGSPYGGLANFYTDYPGYTHLPQGTPEAGKCVVNHWGAGTGHSMTLVGWNDSIRYDFNNDGQYTNNIDINGDGLVNVKDWEIGGFKFVNSFGPLHADSGFCYVMYKVMAEEKPPDGIWNKSVYVQMAEGNYFPKLAFKIRLQHNSRNKLKLTTGVSNDTTDFFPQYQLDYSIFNFQGGDHYMQGNDTSELNKKIEIGLDATPLLSYIHTGEPARFFFQVYEHDPQNKGQGQVLSCSLMDYINGGLEMPVPGIPMTIANNGFTNLSVIHTLNPDQVQILTEELPAFIDNQPFEFQLAAEQGQPPYKWDIVSVYNENWYGQDYPVIEEEELVPNGNTEGYVIKQIPFDFPFYGKTSNEVILFVDGFLGFTEESLPVPYQVDDMVLFRYVKLIAPYLSRYLQYTSVNDDRIWYKGDEEHAAFRWKTSLKYENITYKVDFSVFLYPDGRIEFFFGDSEVPKSIKWITGLSAGDDQNYQVSEFSNLLSYKSDEAIRYTPNNTLEGFSITDEGVLTADPSNGYTIYNITARVTDNNKIFAQKDFQLSNGVLFTIDVDSGGDSLVEYGETCSLDVSLKNISTNYLSNTSFSVDIDNPFITMVDGTEDFGILLPGETVTKENAILLEVDPLVPDQYFIRFTTEITSTGNFWEGQFTIPVFAPDLKIGSPFVIDGGNGWLDPGETADIIIPVINYGHSEANNVERVLETNSPFLYINSNSNNFLGDIEKGETIFDTVNVTIDAACPEGLKVTLDYQLTAEPGLVYSESPEFTIGRYPVLILDLDPGKISGHYIKDYLDEIGLYYEYLVSFPSEMNQFRNIFVLLGKKWGQYILSEAEGDSLAAFLLNGGNIYMEGGVSWYEDPQTSVHSMFNFSTEPITWNEIDSVAGIDGTFTQNMLFTYSGGLPYYNHYLEPIGPAFGILKRNSQPHDFTVAYDNGTYKTIGSNIMFGLLVNGQGISQKYNLLKEYLIFFGLDDLITGRQNHPEPLPDYGLTCAPNPAYSDLRISFTLPERESVSLNIFNMFGKSVFGYCTNQPFPEGLHVAELKLDQLSPGIYIIRFQTKKGLFATKFVISR